MAVLTLFFYSCQQQKREVISTMLTRDSLSYAQRFTINRAEDYIVVTINKPWNSASKNYRYLLVDKQKPVPPVSCDAVIRTPVERLVCTSTSHLAMLELIGAEDVVEGFPGTDLITSKVYHEKIETGRLLEVGTQAGLDEEELFLMNPELIIAFGTGSESEQFEMFDRFGIPYVLNADYMENTPLGRAEWVRFMGLLTNKEETADSVFREIESNYLELKRRAADSEHFPDIMTGIMYGDIWFLPSGSNYSARFFEDAGGNYLWSDEKAEGWLELGYENVLEKAHNADFWLGVASFNSREEMNSSDHRYSQFSPFQDGNLYHYNRITSSGGGTAILELGYARPDLVLSDLIKILHPEMQSDSSLTFYKKLP